MLNPHPESDLSLNILVLGAQIIIYLRNKKTYVYTEEALDAFLKDDSRRTPDMFFNALCFLYGLDIIEYRSYQVRINQQSKGQLSFLSP